MAIERDDSELSGSVGEGGTRVTAGEVNNRAVEVNVNALPQTANSIAPLEHSPKPVTYRCKSRKIPLEK
jgi:hypothetical protein